MKLRKVEEMSPHRYEAKSIGVMLCLVSFQQRKTNGEVMYGRLLRFKFVLSAFTARRRRVGLLFLLSERRQAAQNGSSLLNGIFYDITSSPLGGVMD